MSLDEFDKVNASVKKYTKELAYHIVGDPLVLTNLKDYLNISKNHGLKVNIVTTANNMNEKYHEVLINETIRQINFSLNSYNANSHKKSLDEYLIPIFDFVMYAQNQKHEYFINFRIWNLDDNKSAYDFNKQVFTKINKYFNTNIDTDEVYKQKPKNIKVARKLFIHFDKYFHWPDLKNEVVSTKGSCYGLDSHFGILSTGEVVPCCLDQNASVNLGNVFENGLDDILGSKRVKDIQNGFKNNILVEEFCQKCEYRTRFNKEEG